MAADSARTASVSTTTTLAPSPSARWATPCPQSPKPITTTVRPAISMLVARSTPSSDDWPVPCRLSNRCLVSESLTATTGNRSSPSDSMARRRITPVVVSSMEASGVISVRSVCSSVTRSAPSSIVMVGSVSSTVCKCR